MNNLMRAAAGVVVDTPDRIGRLPMPGRGARRRTAPAKPALT